MPLTPEQQARERFERDTADHEMTVLREDGLYRHVRFQEPGTGAYYYDLVTWPGHLVICGDMGDYHFSRIRDMFDFFGPYRHGINPGYWAEKLQGPHRGSDLAQSYSHEAFRQHVHSWAENEALYNADCEMYPSLLRDALDREVLDDHTTHPDEARERLTAVEDGLGQPGMFGDVWDWDLREFDSRFLWCCWAIVRGIEQYRAARPAGAVSA
jgi:hypothetical protein